MARRESWAANLQDRKFGPLSVMISSIATPMLRNQMRTRSKNPTRVSAVSLSRASTQGQAGVVVYGDVEVAVAHPRPSFGTAGRGVASAVGPPPATGRDPAHLFHIEVHQIARLGALVAVT